MSLQSTGICICFTGDNDPDFEDDSQLSDVFGKHILTDMRNRHCSFNSLNCYKAPDWAILRIKGDNNTPLHFTVCMSLFLEFLSNWKTTRDHSGQVSRVLFARDQKML